MMRTFLALGAVALAACGTAEAHRAAPEPPPVAVAAAPAHMETLPVRYRASGTVRGKNTAVLTSKTTGYVREVRVRAGDRVAAGDVLATLEANDLAARGRRASAGLDEATQAMAESDHALAAAIAASENAKTTRDRAAALLADGSIPKQQYDDADARWRSAAALEDVARARVRGSRSRAEEARAEVAEAHATLDYARIAAPFAGRVIERRVDPGNLASPGTALLVVEQEGALRVEAPVDESRGATIAVGDRATVELDARAGELAGTVSEIVPNVDTASRAFLVKIDLPPDTSGLRAGMFARVAFDVGARARLVVPATAGTASGALDRVFVIDGDRARLRMVTLGERQASFVEVLSGLGDGERVIAAPPPTLRDGAKVAVTP